MLPYGKYPPMATKLKKRTKPSTPVKRPQRLTMNFKVRPSERNAIVAMARKITRGNVTALVLGALKYAPKHGSAIAKGDFRPTTRK